MVNTPPIERLRFQQLGKDGMGWNAKKCDEMIRLEIGCCTETCNKIQRLSY